MIPVIGILGLVAASRVGAKGARPGGGQNQPPKRMARGEAVIKEQDCGMPVLAHAAPAGLLP